LSISENFLESLPRGYLKTIHTSDMILTLAGKRNRKPRGGGGRIGCVQTLAVKKE
jgi:hypothetical protein